MREKLYYVLYDCGKMKTANRVYDFGICVVAFCGVVHLMFYPQTTLINGIDVVAAGLLFVDYLLKLFVYDLKTKKSVFIYPFTPWAVIDMLGLLPTLGLLPAAFRVLRVLRITQIFRHFESFKHIGRAIYKQRKILFSVGVIVLSYIFIAALVLYCAEPENFGSFFNALYFATSSLTTVGNSSINPVGVLGKLVSMISLLLGIGLIALPVGVITAGFIEEMKAGNDNSFPTE